MTTKITTNDVLTTALNAAADVAEAQYGKEAGDTYRELAASHNSRDQYGNNLSKGDSFGTPRDTRTGCWHAPAHTRAECPDWRELPATEAGIAEQGGVHEFQPISNVQGHLCGVKINGEYCAYPSSAEIHDLSRAGKRRVVVVGGQHDSATCTAADNGLPCSMCAWAREVERISRHKPTAQPSRLTVNDLALLRQVVLQVIDDGRWPEGSARGKCPWSLYEGRFDNVIVPEDEANDQRLLFCDYVQRELLRRVAPALVGERKGLTTT